RIDAETEPAIAVKETQAIVSLMVIDAAFADAGDCLRAHQLRQVVGRDIQQRRQFSRIDYNIALRDLNPHGTPTGVSVSQRVGRRGTAYRSSREDRWPGRTPTTPVPRHPIRGPAR